MPGGGKLRRFTALQSEAPAVTNEDPIACSLDVDPLEQRLAAIAEIGAESLISRRVEEDRHLLRFQKDAETRRRLEEIIAAEAECCSFLDLSLDQEEDDLLLSIAAPRDAQALADGLAGAFAGSPISSERSGPARPDRPRPDAS
jgi:hypothetical protein